MAGKLDTKTVELIKRLEDKCLELTGLLEEVQHFLTEVSSPSFIELIKEVRGETGVEYLTRFTSDTIDAVAEATKNLAFIVKWLQCIKGESTTGCSPDLLEKVRLASLSLLIAFNDEKRFNPPYYTVKGEKALWPFAHYKTIKSYLLQGKAMGLISGEIIEMFTKPEDFIEEYNQLAQEINTLVGLIINSFVLKQINEYFKESLEKEETHITEEEANEILPEEEI